MLFKIPKIYKRFDFGLVFWLIFMLKDVPVTIEHDYMDTHRIEKQMGLESCLGRFDVHTNTIIRTGESQAIGGKFLQGLELETPEKCQRLCCETSNCDVYVFEEKNDGYCYLFQCGSPKNFHCKFTRHPNYTSALITQYKSVISTTPRPLPHAFLTNISTQEQELLSLKFKPEKIVVTSTSLPIDIMPDENKLMSPTATENRNLSCGRFEFPCHSGECIAVYNACNGIPQCADGSDEGPECSPATKTLKTNPQQSESLKAEVVQQVPANRLNFKKIEQATIDGNFIENREGSDSASSAWGSQKVLSDMQSDIDRTTFGRKSNIKVQSKDIINLDEPNEKMFPNQRDMYVQAPPIKTSFPTPQIAQPTEHIYIPNARWPSQRQQWQAVNQGPVYSNQEQPKLQNINSEQNRMHSIDDQISKVESSIINDSPVQKPIDRNNADFQGKNVDYANYPEKSVENLKKVPVQTKHDVSKPSVSAKETTHPSVAEQYKMIEQHLEIKFTDHDGHSERPRGAVLSLTLGLLVTGVIVGLIGCRLRTIGRRGGRLGGKVTYAPDEDFLVNGMYL